MAQRVPVDSAASEVGASTFFTHQPVEVFMSAGVVQVAPTPGHCAAAVQLIRDCGMKQRLVVVSHDPAAPPQSASVVQVPGLQTPAGTQAARRSPAGKSASAV